MKWARWLYIAAGLALVFLMLGLAAFEMMFLLKVAENDFLNLIFPALLVLFNLALAAYFAFTTYRIWMDGR